MKKKCLSTFRGTLAGYCALARLLSLFVKLVAKEVSLRGGKFGLNRGRFLTGTVE